MTLVLPGDLVRRSRLVPPTGAYAHHALERVGALIVTAGWAVDTRPLPPMVAAVRMIRRSRRGFERWRSWPADV